MRDNGIQAAQVECGRDTLADFAREALNFLVSVRGPESAKVKQEHMDHFMQAIAHDEAFDASRLLDDMVARRLDPATVACQYVPEAARSMGEQWLSDRMSFVEVTVGTERLHAVVRRVDEILGETTLAIGPSALIVVAEAEHHTLGASVLALQLRAAGFSATVRPAPAAAELTLLMATEKYDLALVSVGCTAALGAGVGLVRTLRLLSRGEMCIYVGGSIPISNERLLSETAADRVLRDVPSLLAEYDSFRKDRALERQDRKSQRLARKPAAKGDGVED